MALTEINMSESEGMVWAAAGFIAMILGLFIFVNNPLGLIVSVIGAASFLVGYQRSNPFHGLTVRHWWLSVGVVVAFVILVGLAVMLIPF